MSPLKRALENPLRDYAREAFRLLISAIDDQRISGALVLPTAGDVALAVTAGLSETRMTFV
jgi:hypothetical protein